MRKCIAVDYVKGREGEKKGEGTRREVWVSFVLKEALLGYSTLHLLALSYAFRNMFGKLSSAVWEKYIDEAVSLIR